MKRPHQMAVEHRGLHEMIAGTIEYGFACGYRPTGGFSIFHDTSQLVLFEAGTHNIHWEPSGRNDTGYIPAKLRPLGEWARYMNYTLPWPAAPACYGGSFAVKASRIAPKRQLMKRFEEALSHGNNIEEGHYAERSWAALFHTIDSRGSMLTPMLKWATSEVNVNGGYMGVLVGCRKPVPCDALQLTSIHTAFEKVDADGNCEISPAELLQALILDLEERPELLGMGLEFKVADAELEPFLLGGGQLGPRWVWRGAAKKLKAFKPRQQSGAAEFAEQVMQDKMKFTLDDGVEAAWQVFMQSAEDELDWTLRSGTQTCMRVYTHIYI